MRRCVLPASGGSGIGTMAAARVAVPGRPDEAFVAVSMYARWMRAHPSIGSNPGSAADGSAHRILSDLLVFANFEDPSHHRVLAAGDLNIFYGGTGRSLSWPKRERTVWDRFEALGLVFLGPQAPNGRPATSPQPDVPGDTRNVPHTAPANNLRQRPTANSTTLSHRAASTRRSGRVP